MSSLENSPSIEVTDTNPLVSDTSKCVCLGEGGVLRVGTGQDRITLKEILQCWLLPRHARNPSEIVERGGILIWVDRDVLHYLKSLEN
jgi:hypothetical protein